MLNTNDSGSDSLRQAILDANSNPGADTIAFNIPGEVPHTIHPLTALDPITDPVTIDGYTQPGSSPNTLALQVGDNAVHLIKLDSSGLTWDAAGLKITGGGTTVKGLRFQNGGIGIYGVGGNSIQGNYIDGAGVEIFDASSNTVGGAANDARNVIIPSSIGVFVMGLMLTRTKTSFRETTSGSTQPAAPQLIVAVSLESP